MDNNIYRKESDLGQYLAYIFSPLSPIEGGSPVADIAMRVPKELPVFNDTIEQSFDKLKTISDNILRIRAGEILEQTKTLVIDHQKEIASASDPVILVEFKRHLGDFTLILQDGTSSKTPIATYGRRIDRITRFIDKPRISNGKVMGKFEAQESITTTEGALKHLEQQILEGRITAEDITGYENLHRLVLQGASIEEIGKIAKERGAFLMPIQKFQLVKGGIYTLYVNGKKAAEFDASTKECDAVRAIFGSGRTNYTKSISQDIIAQRAYGDTESSDLKKTRDLIRKINVKCSRGLGIKENLIISVKHGYRVNLEAIK